MAKLMPAPRSVPRAQAAGEKAWATLHEWDPLGPTAESARAWCYPMAQ